jgi:hypothetical protein
VSGRRELVLPVEYGALVRAFLERKLTAEEFAARYDKAYLKDPHPHMERAVFDILEDLWEDVDAYSPMWTPDELGPTRINEETLRQKAAQALAELVDYLRAAGSSPPNSTAPI